MSKSDWNLPDAIKGVIEVAGHQRWAMPFLAPLAGARPVLFIAMFQGGAHCPTHGTGPGVPVTCMHQ